MFNLNFFIFQVIAYLFGSIPFGLIVSKKAKNVDIRDYGSGNIGATNAVRVLGKKLGALVFLLDGIKAAFPLIIAKYLFGFPEDMLAITTCSIILGHIFPIWLHFKGGKGISCLIFSYFILDWKLGVVFAITWLVIFLFFRISALSALMAVLTSAIMAFFVSGAYFVMSIFLSALIFYRHKINIKNLIENKELCFKK